MNRNEIASITTQDIRKTIVDFLQQRLLNNSHYKVAMNTLNKAVEEDDLASINEAKTNLIEITKKFELETWMEDAATRRIFWISIATNLSKGIHSSSTGTNININILEPVKEQDFVSSYTVKHLPLDCSGNAAALDVFSLINQNIKCDLTLLDLMLKDHPAVVNALSDDKQKAKVYYDNIKSVMSNDFTNPKSSELNKQFYWPNDKLTYLSQEQDDYRLIIPLYPSSLTHIVYQKIQTRFSEQNRLGRKSRSKKDDLRFPYFVFKDLSIVKLGGRNPQGVSQMQSSQGGHNYLLPSLPPIHTSTNPLRITKLQTTIFGSSLRARCRHGFDVLFEVIKTPYNNVNIREKRKSQAMRFILSQFFNTAKKIRNTYPAGWTIDYRLSLNQKCWLDPKRAELPDQLEFKKTLQESDWLDKIQTEFAIWINAEIRKQFKDIANQFATPESNEWQREFEKAVAKSKRRKEGLFDE